VRKPEPFRRGNEVLEKQLPQLSPVLRRAAMLRHLENQLRIATLLPVDVPFGVLNVRHDVLVLATPVSAAVGRIRLQQAAILETAARFWPTPVRKLQVKIEVASAHAPEHFKPLSQPAAMQLRAAAQTLTDPELRAVLEQLASLAE
jgi:hypothetical protein